MIINNSIVYTSNIYNFAFLRYCISQDVSNCIKSISQHVCNLWVPRKVCDPQITTKMFGVNQFAYSAVIKLWVTFLHPNFLYVFGTC